MVEILPSVAIVDDDESVLKALSRLLSAAGLDACAFHSGSEFLDSPSSRKVGCVLLDIRMPDPDGFTVAGKLAERKHTVPVIFMSSHDSEVNRRLAGELGAAFLAKPASESHILAAIRDAFSTGGADETKVP